MDFLFSKGVTQFKLIDSLGATEAYPFTGSAELITDITSTGEDVMSVINSAAVSYTHLTLPTTLIG